ncbi:hypothetical protein BD769DRAFT_1748992 [Suillus cothurnatus]|nr:hypothetical protein BD769DRAFT_1748992 [Suillus cothurnatus]
MNGQHLIRLLDGIFFIQFDIVLYTIRSKVLQTPLTHKGLPKSPHTWTLADPDAVLGLSHSGGTVARWWRPEVLGSTASPGAGGGKKKKKANKGESTEILKGAGALSKAEVGKSYQKRSRHVPFVWLLSLLITFSYSSRSGVKLKSLHQRFSRRAQCIHLHLPFPRLHLLKWVCFAHLSLLEQIVLPQPHVLLFYTDDPFLNARPSSAYLGPPSVLQPPPASPASPMFEKQASGGNRATVTYHGVCLTVWSHADTTRVACIVGGHGPGGSTLFLPGDTVFWLPYALIARLADLQILAHPAPRVGDLIKLDASSTPIPSSSSTPYKTDDTKP